ncbi:calmodulin, putative [Entamoeba dispar SAW760]|uniref:Calmodulin, putative n=1 Tax=Entamoeba dispar (strain ATCC PRA-260 / SAW760) TaxID=370354 RepID=B0E8K2_ENTDS|nr:calmodulin, putative [Entamoeba dispar SAW760]EDR29145.1 calmodulin, putative [Entamoeba dispar SAW760]|eukprot:EDR29145.1 calmodulin, putative [Entamoeba dispar SAW760]
MSEQKKVLTAEEQQEYKEAFQLFDKDNDNKLTAEELGTVMRALGANPTKQKISEIVKDYDKDNSGKFDQETFLTIMLEYGQEVDSTEDIKKAFEIFDKEKNGYISASELKHVLTTLGEKLTEQEVDDLLKEIGVEEGLINVDEFVKLITSK